MLRSASAGESDTVMVPMPDMVSEIAGESERVIKIRVDAVSSSTGESDTVMVDSVMGVRFGESDGGRSIDLYV